MARSTVAFDTESPLAVVAGPARLPFLHLRHGHFLVLFGVQIKFVVAFLAADTCRADMGIVAEGHIT